MKIIISPRLRLSLAASAGFLALTFHPALACRSGWYRTESECQKILPEAVKVRPQKVARRNIVVLVAVPVRQKMVRLIHVGDGVNTSRTKPDLKISFAVLT
jgi:hypothetical protein